MGCTSEELSVSDSLDMCVYRACIKDCEDKYLCPMFIYGGPALGYM